MTSPLDQALLNFVESLVERIAERAAENVLERLQPMLDGARSADGANLLDVKAAAEKLHVPVGAVYKLASNGKLTAVKVGGRLRFRVADIEQLIEQGTRSESRVRALAASAKADAGRSRSSARRAPGSRRGATAAGAAERADRLRSPASVEPDLKVLTDNNPDAARTRRTGG